jgi:hypothetical protein
MDQHCSWQTSDAINKLFGINAGLADKRDLKLTTESVHTTKEGANWGLNSANLADFRIAEPSVKVTTGASLFEIGNADAAIVNRVGKGWAIYLNTTFDQYPKQRAVKFGGSGYRELANALFKRAGVRPVVEVTSPDGRPITRLNWHVINSPTVKF